MFKWRSHERSKITAIFKLQFHVTQVAEIGGSGLVISVVPAENGKPTAKLEKCVIEENNCFWENAVFETVKFILDPKSGKILDKIYYFFISTGSGKGSVVGEFCVNIAEYVGATKACSLSFPFKNSTSDTQFHVLIQRIQENGNLREPQENEVLISKQDDRTLRRHFSNGDVEDGAKASVEDEPLRKATSLQPTLHGTRRGSSGSDVTLSSTDSSSGLNTPREVSVQSNNSNKDQDQQRTQWELAIVPVNDSSSVYSLNSPRDVFLSETSQIGLDDSVDKLKADLVALSRRAEVSELELQTLRKQIVKESKKGQDMLKEITMLKEEKNALNDECEKLKAYRKRSDDFKVKSKYQFEGDPWTFLEEIKEELNYEKEINANLRIQLQKTQDSNAELLFAVQDLEEMLEKNDKEVSHASNKVTSGESAVEIEENMLKSQSDDDEEQKALEDLVRQHSDAQETYLYEQKIMDLCSEIEMYRRDKDELEMQMEQLALDYEILKQENHEYCSRLEQNHLQDQLQCEGSSSYTAMKELEALREKLENELAEKSEELSHCLGDVKDLEARNLSLSEKLQKQAGIFEADMGALTRVKTEHEKRASRAEEALIKCDAIINELEAKIDELETEQEKNRDELTGSVATINELETRNRKLEQELEKQAEGYEASMEVLVHAKMEQEQRAMRAEDALTHCNATINELEGSIKNLENELKLRSEESSGNLATIKELESHIQDLEEELEKQVESFEADLEVVTRAKVDQEQRAIRAEEALRLVRWKNANTATRIQDEFKRLSTQMQSSFDANEKIASKALTEASELRMHNRHLRDLLQKANDDVQSTKHDYETKLHELCCQIEEKSKLVETEKSRTEEVQKNFFAQESDFRAEIERLVSENKSLSSELEQLKTLVREKDELLQRETTEKDGLRETIASAKEVGGKSMEEVIVLRHLKDEKDQIVKNLQSEVNELRARCDNFKNSLYEDESEKERLRKQVFQLQADLSKKDEAISIIEKKLKENKNAKSETPPRPCKEFGSKEVVTLKERVKLLEGQIKLKENAFETSATAFLAKEKLLQGKIEELETRLGGLDPSPGIRHDTEVKEEKVSVGTQVFCDEPEEPSSAAKNSDLEFNSNGQIPSETQPTQSDTNSGEQNKFDILLKEMVALKERNNSMEDELKEMQERYSEISLKFAEVEGERQQLVMKLRNLKNKKGRD
ncbi:hypothetical protein RND81_13G039200 [Saponaria officinalis]|uniref:C2 NT-type domain-containing protein n=2 Tax=Saponaria officinalis TaxID=3572 RepID=A0AAW1GVT5_SAPOF